MIHPLDLKKALSAVQRSCPLPKGHAFLNLHLVQRRLSTLELRGTYIDLWAVREVLLESLSCKLDKELSLATILLHHHFCSANPFTQNYMLLYWYYLRPDLGLTIEVLGREVGYSARTLNRRMTEGIHHLTLDIATREIEFRRSRGYQSPLKLAAD